MLLSEKPAHTHLPIQSYTSLFSRQGIWCHQVTPDGCIYQIFTDLASERILMNIVFKMFSSSVVHSNQACLVHGLVSNWEKLLVKMCHVSCSQWNYSFLTNTMVHGDLGIIHSLKTFVNSDLRKLNFQCFWEIPK